MGKYDALFDEPAAAAPARGRYAALFDDAPAPPVAAAAATPAVAEGPAYQPPVPAEQAALAAPGHGTQPQDGPLPVATRPFVKGQDEPTLTSTITGRVPVTSPGAAAPPPADIPWYKQIGMGIGGDRPPGAGPGLDASFGQGVSFGLRDEIAGGLDTLASKVPGVRNAYAALTANPSVANNPALTFDQRAQAYRDQVTAERQAHPIAAPLAEAAGGAIPAMIPGANAAAAVGEGAGLATAAGRGFLAAAPLGYVQGIGDSDKLSKGDVAGAVQQGARTALIAGATGAVLEPAIGVVTRKVSERMGRQLAREITESEAGSATPTSKKLIAKDLSDVTDTLMADPQLASAVRKPASKALKVVQPKIGEVQMAQDAPYRVVDDATEGVRAGDFVNHLRSEAKAWRRGATGKGAGVAAELEKRANMIVADEAWGGGKHAKFDPDMDIGGGMKAGEQIALLEKVAARGDANAAPARADIARVREMATRHVEGFDPNKIVPMRQVREQVTDLQNTAFSGEGHGAVNETDRYKKARDVAGVAADFLNEHLDKAAQISPQVAEAVAQIRANNTKISALLGIERALKQRAVKEATNGMSLKARAGQIASSLPALAGIGLGAAHGHLGTAAALGAAGAVAMPAAAAARAASNRAIASLVQAARKGSVSAGLIQHAIEAGVPRVVALRLARAGTIGISGLPSLQGKPLDATNP